MRNGMRGRAGRHGFTLIELLTVVGIIMLLVSILLPLVSTLWQRAQKTDTTHLIGQLATAIQNYRDDYSAYPGPVREEALYGFGLGVGTQSLNLTANATAPSGDPALPTPPSQLTSSQNLVLGLLGGLSYSSTAPGVYYNPAQISRGVANLNPGVPANYKTYYDIKNKSDLSRDITGNLITPWIPPTASAFVPTGTCVPEFMDHYSNPHPIIYLRARVGSPSAVDTAVTPTAQGVNQSSQYYSAEMSPYWIGGWRETTTGVFTTNPGGAMFPSYYEKTLSGGADTVTLASLWPNSPPTTPNFFQNPAYTVNQSTTARGQDAFMLISAGYDGYYGSADDIIYPPPP